MPWRMEGTQGDAASVFLSVVNALMWAPVDMSLPHECTRVQDELAARTHTATASRGKLAGL